MLPVRWRVPASPVHRRRINAIESYAKPLGLAFQIVDDLLEITGDQDRLGKSTASDQKHGKVTYPGAVGVDAARARAEALADQAKDALTALPGNTSILAALADLIVCRDR